MISGASRPSMTFVLCRALNATGEDKAKDSIPMIQISKSSRRAARHIAWVASFALANLSAPLIAQEAGTHRAVITIPNPKSANLLRLRGFGGRGAAHIRIGQTCHRLPVRLVAGDFSGESVHISRSAPIVVEISDPQTVEALLAGADIVSDEAEGIEVLSGLSGEAGFVINPGRNVTADIFGVQATATSCDVKGTRSALEAASELR